MIKPIEKVWVVVDIKTKIVCSQYYKDRNDAYNEYLKLTTRVARAGYFLSYDIKPVNINFTEV